MPENRRVRATAVGAILALTIGMFSVDYTVQRGDTLRKIANEHDVSLTELIEINDIDNPHLIYPGQVLVIPGDEPDVVHFVVWGDTLGRIAAAYDTTISALVEANAISNPNMIRVGQQIVISGSDTTPPPRSSDSETVPSSDPNVRTGAYHIVKRGESLADIAAEYPDVTADRIAVANGIVGGVVYAGTRLFLDGPGYVAAGSAGTRLHIVSRGDRLGDIAARNEVSVNAIMELNDITDPNVIRLGQKILIPTGQAWRCPVDDSFFFNDWGFTRGGGTRWHDGNDLYAERGTPIYAPVSGVVKEKIGRVGGNQVNLYGDDGVIYINSHLDSFGATGEVEAGEVIGYVGTTGSAKGTRPHLHFMMFIDDGDMVVNPYPTLIKHGC